MGILYGRAGRLHTKTAGFRPTGQWVGSLTALRVDGEERMYLTYVCPSTQVRMTPSWPRSWANFSLSQLYSHRNAWANLHRLGQPNNFLAIVVPR